MKKLKLRLEDLKVESFETAPEGDPTPQGTVFAYISPGPGNTCDAGCANSTCVNTCADTCGDTCNTTCVLNTCGTCQTCGGPTCEQTCGGPCGVTCPESCGTFACFYCTRQGC